MVHFVMDAVEQLDLRAAQVNHRGTGSLQYPPSMMLGLLIYCYANGVFSSREIERLTYENVAVRVLCADTHPDHDTICSFRRRNKELLESAFVQVLELAARCEVLKVGSITVSIDGTKLLANASRHSAMSYQRVGEEMCQAELEIRELLAKAEEADATPLEDGLTISGEVSRREKRLEKLAAARKQIEERVSEQLQKEQADYEAKQKAREAERAEGKKPRGRPPRPPRQEPHPKEQINFTDPESRIMPVGSKGRFEQAYNAQGAVEIESRLIVGERVSTAPNDKQELVPDLEAIVPAAGPVSEVLVDSGFVSEEAINQVEKSQADEDTGVRVLAAVRREPHGRRIKDLEKRADPPPPPSGASFTERMAHRVSTKAGRERYKLRQQTVEPVFGIIKEAMGFRRFSLRGKAKVGLEWTLVCLAYNVRRLHRVLSTSKITPQTA